MNSKVFVLATCQRSFLDLKNVVLELKNRNIPYFFLYNDTPKILSPKHSLKEFSYDSNMSNTDRWYAYDSIGFNLPFKPDILLITKENWDPEKSILLEFKQRGTFVCCVENSSWIHNNIKTKLEIASRKSFPSNCIDVFFDHSEWCKQTKVLAGWYGVKSIVTGNPKYDDFNFSNLRDENVIIVYGSMEKEHHGELLNIYKLIKDRLIDWTIYYKPHPNELTNFFGDFTDVNYISDYDIYVDTLKKSKYNIGLFTSVMYLPLVMNKNIVYVNQQTSGSDKELDIENFRGHEFDFWKRILGFDNFDDFLTFISESYVVETYLRNKNLEDCILNNLIEYDKDLNFLGKTSNNKNLSQYYDEFNDQKASKRIVDFLETLIL